MEMLSRIFIWQTWQPLHAGRLLWPGFDEDGLLPTTAQGSLGLVGIYQEVRRKEVITCFHGPDPHWREIKPSACLLDSLLAVQFGLPFVKGFVSRYGSCNCNVMALSEAAVADLAPAAEKTHSFRRRAAVPRSVHQAMLTQPLSVGNCS